MESTIDKYQLFDIISSGQPSIKNQYILQHPKTKLEKFSESVKVSCRFLKFTNEWKIEEISAEIATFHQSCYPNLLGIVIDIEEIAKEETKINEISKYFAEIFFDVAADFRKNHPFILQWTSKRNNLTKLYYKDETSVEFFEFDIYRNQPKMITNFVEFLWVFINKKMDQFEDAMIDALPNVENLSLIWKFLKTLELPENFFHKCIIKCAEKGNKDQFLTVLDASYENGVKTMNESVKNNITRIFKLDSSNSSAEQSILHVALKNSNYDVIEFLTEECSYLVKHLPFNQQINISSAAYDLGNNDVFCDFIEFFDFPFPKDFEENSVNNKRLKKIIENRQEFHKAIRTGNFVMIDNLVKNLFDQKIIYDIKNRSALYQAVLIKNFNTYHYLKTAYGFEASGKEEEDKGMKEFTKQYVHKLTVTDAIVKSSVLSSDTVINKLIAKSSIHFTRKNRDESEKYHKQIKKWYQQIEKMKFGLAMLKVVSSCDKLKIVYDFGHEFTNEIDYTESDNKTIGISIMEQKWIFIGAKDSGDIKRDRIIRGTIAHECCHYAIYLVFKNLVKPYFNSKDKKIELLYQKIIKDVFYWLRNQPKNENGDFIDQCESIIFRTFKCYGEMTEHSIPMGIEQELIVRVVEILAYFNDDEDKIRKLEELFTYLFDFYKTYVNSEFEKFNFEDQQLVSEFNDKTGVLTELEKSMYIGDAKDIELIDSKVLSKLTSNKITIVVTNIPKLFLYDIYSNFHPKGCNLFGTENILVHVEQLIKMNKKEKNNILKDLKYVLAKASKMNVFINCSKQTDFKPIWHDWNKNTNFIYILNDYDEDSNETSIGKLKSNEIVKIKYRWENLSMNTRKSLLNTKINFHNRMNHSIQELLSSGALDVNQQISSNVMDPSVLKMLIEKTPISVNVDTKKPNVEFNLLNQLRTIIKNANGINESEIKLDEFLENTKENKFILFVDIAGSGKSWAFLNAEIKIKILPTKSEKFPTKWVTLVDLKQYIPIFKAEDLKYQNIDCESKLEFSNFIAQHILNSELEFGKNLFKEMYKIGKVIILFDGFDEIAPDCAEFVSQLAESFEWNGGNQLWISTRNNFEVELKEKLKLDVSYKLNDFTEEDGIDLICKIWTLNDLKVEEGEKITEIDFLKKFKEIDNKEIYRSKARDLVKKISYLRHGSIGVICLYKILADIGKSIQSVDELSEYEIFKKFSYNHHDLWAYEKGQIRKEANGRAQVDRINFYDFHTYEAIKIFDPEFAPLCGLEYDEDNWSDADIIGCGLMSKENGKFYFIHRTFVEFFVADYVVKNFVKILKLKKVEDSIIEFITKVISESHIICMFIDGGLAENAKNSKTTQNAENSKIKMIVDAAEKNDKVGKKISKLTEKLNIFKLIFDIQNLDNLGKILNLGFENKNYEKIKKELFNTIHEKIQNKILRQYSDEEQNLAYLNETAELLKNVVASFLDFKVFEYLIEKITENYGSDVTKSILRENVNYKYEYTSYKLNIIQVLSLTIGTENDKFVKFVKILERFFTTSELMEMIKETNKYDENIFHVSILKLRNQHQLEAIWRAFESIFKSYDSLQMFGEFVMQVDKDQQTFLHFAVEYCQEIKFHDTLWKLLLETFKNNRDEMWKFLNQNGGEFNKKNFVHDLVRHRKPEIIKFTFDIIKDNFGTDKLLELLGKCDEFGSNVLQYAALMSSSENYEFVFSELQKLTSKQKFRRMVGSLDYEKKNLLQSAAYEKSSLKLHQFLWNCFRKYFDTSEIIKLIKHSDDHGNNLLHNVIKRNTKEVIEFTWNEIQKTLEEHEKKSENFSNNINDCNEYIIEVLKSQNNSSKNNQREVIAEKLDLSWIEDKNLWIFKLPAENFDEQTKNTNLFENSTDFDNLAACVDLEIHRIAWKFIREKFINREELKKNLLSENIYGNNYIHQLINSKNSEIIRFTLAVLSKILNYSQIKDILSSRGSKEQNLLQTAAVSLKKDELYNVLWNYLCNYFKESEIENFIRHPDSDGNRLLHYAAHWSVLEVFKSIWTNLKNSTGIFKNLILKLKEGRNNFGENIFHRSIRSNDKEKLEILWTDIENFFKSCNSTQKFREFVIEENDNQQTILHSAAQYCNKYDVHVTLWKLLLKTFENNRDELWNFINQIGGKWIKANMMHYLMWHSKPDIVAFTHDIIKKNFGSDKLLDILKKCEDEDTNVFHYITLSLPSDVFEFLINELQEQRSEENIRKILSSFDDNTSNILQSAVEKNKCLSVHECLWKCIQKYFSSSEILKFIKHYNKHGYNLLHIAVKMNTNEVAEFTWNSIKEILSKDEQVEYLKEKDKRGISLLQIACSNDENPNVKEWFRTVMDKNGMNFF